ncbi:AMP-binding protein [Ilumatobacter sp.]|uniref:AMP-binding protein n=1 Tax=Ilumatobacter sp. TaxID=1967498 RepID=UPI003B52E330
MAEPAIAAGPTGTPLLDDTIPADLARTVAEHGDREALVSCHQGIRWTYDEFADRVHRLATGFFAAGLRTGDRVGLWSPNVAEWTLVQFATAEIGVILVNVNPAYRTDELGYALRQSGCRWLVSASSFRDADHRAMAAEVRPGLDDLERVVFLDDDDFAELCRGDRSVAADVAAVTAGLDPDDAINIQYTSGTTGFPKGATLTHRGILNNGHFVVSLQELGPGDRVCIPVPFYHCFGMVMGNLGCTSIGATMVIPGAAFDPAAVLAAVQDERCTALYGVPTMFIAEMAHPEFASFDLSSLRTGVMAGSLCPVEVMRRCIDEMNLVDIGICYGMTETSPVSTQTMPGDTIEHRTESVGVAHPHVEIRVCDPETGDTVERGETGEFCTRGYSVMKGYWNDDERTAAVIDDDGWMHTGDLAVMAPDGYVDIVGRIKDMVIRGGENVSPREVEDFLRTHPDVEDVQVIGVPDERYGEELMAWIRPRPGAEVDVESVRDFCRGRIARFKIPRYVKTVEEFPMTVTGKVRKVEMREIAVAELASPDVTDASG